MSKRVHKETVQSTAKGVRGFLAASYREGMNLGEKIGYTMASLPLDIAEAAGLPADKTKGIRDFNNKFVGGFYRSVDGVVTKLSGGLDKLLPGEETPVTRAKSKAVALKAKAKKAGRAVKAKVEEELAA